MVPTRISSLLAGLVVVFMAADVQAQSSLFNSSSSQSNTSSNRSSGLNNSGLRAGSTGQGLTGPQFNSSLGQASSNAGNNGFIGANNAQNGFIGIRQDTTQQNFQQGNQFQNLNRALQGQNNQNGGNQGVERRMAPARTRIAFDYAKKNSVELQTNLASRLSKYSKFSNASTSLAENGVLTIRGNVKSDDDRKLAEALMRLEPGVTGVENLLTVEKTISQ